MDDDAEPLGRRWFFIHPHARFWVWLFIIAVVALMSLYAWLHPYLRQRAAVRAIEAAGGHVVCRKGVIAKGFLSDLREQLALKVFGEDAFSVVYMAWITSDNMAEYLHCFPELETIVLDSPDATDAALANLQHCPLLKSVTVSKAGITWAVLGTLNQLEELYVCNTPIADAGLEEIAKLPRLKSLWLQNAGVTPKGLEKFKRARPDCAINEGMLDPFL